MNTTLSTFQVITAVKVDNETALVSFAADPLTGDTLSSLSSINYLRIEETEYETASLFLNIILPDTASLMSNNAAILALNPSSIAISGVFRDYLGNVLAEFAVAPASSWQIIVNNQHQWVISALAATLGGELFTEQLDARTIVGGGRYGLGLTNDNDLFSKSFVQATPPGIYVMKELHGNDLLLVNDATLVVDLDIIQYTAKGALLTVKNIGESTVRVQCQEGFVFDSTTINFIDLLPNGSLVISYMWADNYNKTYTWWIMSLLNQKINYTTNYTVVVTPPAPNAVLPIPVLPTQALTSDCIYFIDQDLNNPLPPHVTAQYAVPIALKDGGQYKMPRVYLAIPSLVNREATIQILPVDKDGVALDNGVEFNTNNGVTAFYVDTTGHIKVFNLAGGGFPLWEANAGTYSNMYFINNVPLDRAWAVQPQNLCADLSLDGQSIIPAGETYIEWLTTKLVPVLLTNAYCYTPSVTPLPTSFQGWLNIVESGYDDKASLSVVGCDTINYTSKTITDDGIVDDPNFDLANAYRGVNPHSYQTVDSSNNVITMDVDALGVYSQVENTDNGSPFSLFITPSLTQVLEANTWSLGVYCKNLTTYSKQTTLEANGVKIPMVSRLTRLLASTNGWSYANNRVNPLAAGVFTNNANVLPIDAVTADNLGGSYFIDKPIRQLNWSGFSSSCQDYYTSAAVTTLYNPAEEPEIPNWYPCVTQLAGQNIEVQMSSVVYGNGVWVGRAVLVSDRYHDVGLMWSTDLVTWNNGLMIDDNSSWGDIVFGGNMWMAINYDQRQAYLSYDGKEWIPVANDVRVGANRWVMLIYGAGIWWLAGGGANYDTSVYWSTDGTTWTAVTGFKITSNSYYIMYNNNQWVIMNVNNVCYVSYDGKKGQPTDLPTLDWGNIRWFNGQWFITATTTYTSSDGANWEGIGVQGGAVPFQNLFLNNQCYSNDVFIYAQNNNTSGLIISRNNTLDQLTPIPWSRITIQLSSGASSTDLPSISTDGKNKWIIAVPQSRSIVISEDNGLTWSAPKVIPFSFAGGLKKAGNLVATNGNTLVILKNGGLAYSLDNGSTWQDSIPSSSFHQHSSVIFGGGVFLSIDSLDMGKCWRSENGINWEETSLFGLQIYEQLVFNGNVWVALSNFAGSNPLIYFSKDGKQWSLAKLPVFQFGNHFENLTWTGASWVASTGYNEPNQALLTSSNGADWEFIQFPIDVTNVGSSNRVFYYVPNAPVSKRHVMLCNVQRAGAYSDQWFYSSDGVQYIVNDTNWGGLNFVRYTGANSIQSNPPLWTPLYNAAPDGVYYMTDPTQPPVQAMVYDGTSTPIGLMNIVSNGAGSWLGQGGRQSDYSIYYSSDALSWQLATFPSGWKADRAQPAIWGDDKWVITGYNTISAGVMWSSDGAVWNTVVLTSASMAGLAFGNGTWVASGENPNASYSSQDGINWELNSLPTTYVFDQIAFINGCWWASSSWLGDPINSPGIWWSLDGFYFRQVNPNIGEFNQFILSSPNTSLCQNYDTKGVWFTRSTPRLGSPTDLMQSNVKAGAFNPPVFDGGRWLAGSQSGGGLLTSIDAKNWAATSLTNGNYNTPALGNSLWVAPSNSNAGLAWSSDGTTWEVSNLKAGSITTPAWANNLWVAGSKSESGIYMSTDGKIWRGTSMPPGTFGQPFIYNGLWVMGSSSGKGVWASTDGQSWTQTNITTGSWGRPAAGYTRAGKDVWVIGGGSPAAIMYSYDGFTWNRASIYIVDGGVVGDMAAVRMQSKSLSIITNQVVNFVVGCANKWGIFYSSDGVTWGIGTQGGKGINAKYSVVTGGIGGVVVASDGIPSTSPSLVSLDGGATWQKIRCWAYIHYYQGGAFGKGNYWEWHWVDPAMINPPVWDSYHQQWITTSYSCSVNDHRVESNGWGPLFSKDGIEWQFMNPFGNANGNQIYFSGNGNPSQTGIAQACSQFSSRCSDGTVVVGKLNNTGIWRLPNGNNGRLVKTNVTEGSWATPVLGNNNVLVSIRYDNDLLPKWSSDNGVTWNDVTNLPLGNYSSPAYSNGVWSISVINGTGTYWSLDGKDWVKPIDLGFSWSTPCFANNTWVIGGLSNQGVYYSQDNGGIWTQSNLNSGNIFGVIFANGIFIASTSKGLWYSTNGVSWTVSNITTGQFNPAVIGGVIVASSTNNGVFWSTDGKIWASANLTGDNYGRPAYDDTNNQWLITQTSGVVGSIFTSEDGINWMQLGAESYSFNWVGYGNDYWVLPSATSTGLWYLEAGDVQPLNYYNVSTYNFYNRITALYEGALEII